jgi:hypothetical protein
MKRLTFIIALALAVIGGAVSLAARDAAPASDPMVKQHQQRMFGNGDVGGWWPLTAELPARH